MPYKDKDKQKQSQHESYLRNKEKISLANKRKRLISRRWLNELKNKPCKDCGNKFPPYVMDFHHRNPTEKFKGVAFLIINRSRQSVIDEIKKCDLICANCHRIRSHGRFDGVV